MPLSLRACASLRLLPHLRHLFVVEEEAAAVVVGAVVVVEAAAGRQPGRTGAVHTAGAA